jgi:1-acyl-sn-glycerol-3-phosphate acyltransferase
VAPEVVREPRGFWLRLAAFILVPLSDVLIRRTWLHRERLPASGPAILAVNHNSQADPLILAHLVYRIPRQPRFLAKHSLFDIPAFGTVLRGTNQIPVRRNTRDAGQALAAAEAALREGGMVIIYPEGTTTRDRDLWPMEGRTGAARLALTTGAPVIPVAHWGGQALHDPRRRGRGIRLRPLRPVTVLVGEPVDLSAFQGRPVTGALLTEATEAIMRRLADMVGEIRGQAPPAELCRQRATAGEVGR